MKKRLGLAQALLGSPELILMDEPMNGLDVLGLEMLADAIRTAAKQGCCVLVSSHNLELLGELCDSVYGVLDHKLVQVKPEHINRAGLRDAYLELCK